MDVDLEKTPGIPFATCDSVEGVAACKSRSLFAREALIGQFCQELLLPFWGLVTNGFEALEEWGMLLQMGDGDLAPELGYWGVPCLGVYAYTHWKWGQFLRALTQAPVASSPFHPNSRAFPWWPRP